MDQLSVLAGELLWHIALVMPKATLYRLGNTCRRLHAILGDERLWKPHCLFLDKANPAAWGRDWRWLYRAGQHVIESARASGRVPDDRLAAIVGRRPLREAQPVAYVGEMDSEHNPHGYGILYFAGPFVPHLSDAVHEGKVSSPLETAYIDIATHVCFHPNGARTDANLFPTDEEADRIKAESRSHIRPDGTTTLGYLVQRGIEATRRPTLSQRISTGDWLEGLWYRGKLRNGTARYHDHERDFYYEGPIVEGVMSGMGRSLDHEGNVYVGHWHMNERHGRGTLFASTGDSYECEWTDGVCDTKGVMRSASDGTVHEGDVMCETGWVKVTFPGGKSTIEGEWDGRNVRGFVCYTESDGTDYYGQWGASGGVMQPNGYGISRHPSGFADEGFWSGGNAQGESVLFYGPLAYMRFYSVGPSRILVRIVVDDLDEPLRAATAWMTSHPSESSHCSGDNDDPDGSMDEFALVPLDSRPWEDIAIDSLTFSIVPRDLSLPALFCAIVAAYRLIP